MTASHAPVLEVCDAHVSFALPRSPADVLRSRRRERLVAVDGVDVQVASGETVGIVGESGSGKSTLARAIVGLIALDAGMVRFEGAPLVAADGGAIVAERRRRVQMIFQDPYSSLNPRLRLGQAITEPAVVHGLVRDGGRDALARELLARVGLSPTLVDRRPAALSGGQRQRVAIARALAAEPLVIVADESVSALDVSVQAQVLNLFMEIQRDLGTAIVFISHQLSVVAHIAQRVAVMYLGRIVESGRADEVFARPAHPYTRGLLAAQPGRSRAATRQASPAERITGEIPSPINLPSGCRFRSRCPVAQEICAVVDPAPTALSTTHLSHCHVVPAQMQDGSSGDAAGPPRQGA
jgi:oligopeptide/dipeptide ABC transporter ATP-binding protein